MKSTVENQAHAVLEGFHETPAQLLVSACLPAVDTLFQYFLATADNARVHT
jgi:hypothetical protein